MKARTSFLKRCLALALALMMLVSGTNMGIVMQAFAAGDKISVSYGEIVAANYDDLSDAEKALLSSGYLAGGTYEHAALGKDLVTVDTENKTITAANSGDWKPTSARIIVDGVEVENIPISNGECKYTYDENAFSVKVWYRLNTTVSKADQNTLLNTGSWLKAGIANVDKLVAQSGLEILEEAMPDLVEMSQKGYQVGSMTASVADDTKAAINRLNDQMTANGGNLDLVVMQDSYSSCKTQYLLNNGMEMKAKLEETKTDVEKIHTLLGTIQTFSGSFDVGEALKLVELLYKILGNWIATADAVIAGDWTAAEKGTALVSGSVNYTDLDAKVAALGDKTEVTVKTTLKVATDSVQMNMDMFDVTVKVVLKTTQDNEVKEYNTVTGKVTLTKNATAEVIAAAAKDIIKGAQSSWGDAYVDGKFSRSESTLPDTLTEDITYTVTYAPVEYEVTKWDNSVEKVPYGYQYTLPKHEDASKSYDYYVNGDKYAQGDKYTVIGETAITRASGKAYTTYDLYAIIADNYGDDVAKKILTSGALKDNVSISVRKIDGFEADTLVALAGGKVTAEGEYAADYKGKNWIPYTYGATGTEKTFGGATTAEWSGDSVTVQYRLTLDNFSEAKVTEILENVAAIKAEAGAQKSVLDTFNQNYETMGQLDKTKLGALNGVIGVTDFTEGDGTDTDAKNLELRAYFSETVGNIIAKNLDSDGKLKIYNMLGQYQSGGLKYYYEDSAAFIAEINALSGYLDELLAEEAALKIMVTAAGYPEYADKISDLGGKMNTVKTSLTAPNAMIDLGSAKLGNLIEILVKDGDATYTTPGHPYLTSENLTVTDASKVMIQVRVSGIEATDFLTATPEMERGTVVTDKVVDELIAAVEGKLKAVKGDNAKHYKIDYSELKALAGAELNETAKVELTCEAEQYTVTLWDNTTKTIDIDNRTIKLPAHEKNGWAYIYSTPEGKKSAYTEAVEYTVAIAHLENFTITREEKDVASENFDNAFGDNDETDVDGNKILHANATGSDMMGWAMTLANSGYNPIKLNGRDFVYLNEKNETEICLQALIDAMLEDKNFSSEALIKLGENGSGTLFTAKLELDEKTSPNYVEQAAFDFNFKSVPAEMATVANYLTLVKDYMTFNADGKGTMNLNLTLPDPVYEAYVTVLLGAGELDKADFNTDEFNDEIAAMFLYDYIDLIVNTDATTTTYTNTLKKLGIDKDLTRAEGYYQHLKKALTGKHDKLDIGINSVEDDGIVDVSVAANGQASINKLLALTGLSGESLETYTAMIKEFKSGDLAIDAVADLKNTPHKYDALVLDIDADGITKKFDYTTNLASKSTAGKAAVMLLDDVTGNVNFAGTTVLDLNGYTITGNVTAAGDLYIVDSSMETESGAGIIGNVSAASVVALGGMVNVAPRAGYVKNDAGYIHSELFEVAGNETDGYTYKVNTDVIESDTIGSYTAFAKLLAVDVAVDVALNYYTASALTADNCAIYALNLDELIALVTGEGKVEAVVNKVLGCFDAPALADFANIVLEDLLAFSDIAEALNANEAVASYTLTTNPWKVGINHNTTEDYIDFGLVPNTDIKNSRNIGIAFVGDNKQPVADLCAELGKIAEVSVEVALEQPTFAAKKLTVKGSLYETAKIDMSGNTDYAKMLGIILAYGNSAKRAAVADAINNDDMDALKKVVDNTSVAELFTALKKMSRSVNLTEMAGAVGATEGIGSIAELEAVYHVFLCAAGKALEKAEITGMDSKFGSLYNETTGQYELLKSKLFKKDEAIRSYSVFAELDVLSVGATVKLFPEKTPELTCLWGDVNHDNQVTSRDAAIILEYLVDANPSDFVCKERADVYHDGQITSRDAAVILEYLVDNITELPEIPE